MLQQLDTAIGFSVVMLMLSLLVTAGVQMISALMDLRGKNLERALTDLFHQIAPDLRETARKTPGTLNRVREMLAHPFSRITSGSRLAEAVVTHPALSHTFARAKAIREDELLAVLKDLCSTTTQGRIDDQTRNALKTAVESRVPGGSGTVAALELMLEQLANRFPDVGNQFQNDLKSGLQQVLATVGQLEAEIEKWFDTIMDRASDVFTRWTRVITVMLTISLVVVLHIDSGEILHQISANPELKAGLVKMGDATLAQADKIFDNRDRASAAIGQLAEKHKDDALGNVLKNAPKGLISCVDGEEWIDGNVKSSTVDPPRLDQLQQEFSEICQEQTQKAMGTSGDQLRKISAELKGTDLTIVPDRVNGITIFRYDADNGKDVGSLRHALHVLNNWWLAYWTSRRHMLGTLASVFLLSLGAPFWFNALKQMSNLKPAITSKIEKEQSSDASAS
jgi:hypothetical protein